MRSTAASILFKYLIAITSLGGVIISLICYKSDGYSFCLSRLLYFTGQSNIWIGLTCFVLAVYMTLKSVGIKIKVYSLFYSLKYVFTVSITVTLIIYCFLLSPFADESYNVWSLGSILTHLAAPVLAIIDYFFDDYSKILKKRHIFYSLIPPFCYVLIASILCLFKFDFGRGQAYPYFFMNYRSPAGLFGFTDKFPFIMGAMYWIIIFALLVLAVAAVYYYLHPSVKNKNIKARLD